MQVRFVVIGNGVAGMEAAKTVRAREPDAEITLISEESDHFFSRTALMYVAIGQMSHADIEPLERGVYERLRLRRVRARAIGLDPQAHQVLLAGGLAPVPYDRLLIACGSIARAPDWAGYDTLSGVGHFVTLQDLAWFEQELFGGPSRGGAADRADAHLAASTDDSPYRVRRLSGRGRPPAKVTVVGGGLIGIEVVEVCLAAKVPVRFLLRDEHFWPVALDGKEAAWIADRLRHHGVDVRVNHTVTHLEGDTQGHLNRVHTTGGPLDSELVVAAIGVVPNTAWLGSTLDRDAGGGLVVDEQLRTSAPDVYAAGDCASVRWFDGRQRPEQLWYTGRDQGRVAGRNLLGDEVRYERGPWYNSAKLMDMEYTTAGLVGTGQPGEHEWFFEETGRVHSTLRIVLQNDKVIGFNALGRRWDHETWIRWIQERRSLAYVHAHLDEARFDTEFVPPLRLPAL